jgi:hypothetical protein
MFIVNDNYLVTHTVYLGKDFGEPSEDSVYITLKEPSTQDFISFQKASNGKEHIEIFENMIDLLPKCIKDHNFYESEKKKLNNDQVVGVLSSKMEILKKVVNDLSENILFLLIKKQSEEQKISED